MTNEIPQDRFSGQEQPRLPGTQPVDAIGSVPLCMGNAERIQRAMATGHLEFDEIGDRFEMVYRAQSGPSTPGCFDSSSSRHLRWISIF